MVSSGGATVKDGDWEREGGCGCGERVVVEPLA